MLTSSMYAFDDQPIDPAGKRYVSRKKKPD
jgi:hypothetical protein